MAEFKLEYATEGNNELSSIKVSESGYAEAATKGMTFRSYVNRRAFEAAASEGKRVDTSRGEPFMQSAVIAGMFPEISLGEPSLTMDKVMSTTLRAPDGQDTSVASTVLYPQLILEAVSKTIRDGVQDGGLLQKYESMVAYTRNLNGARFDQPVIDMRGPENSEAQIVSQLSGVPEMISITLGERGGRIPTESVGLMISKEAQAATTFDLLTKLITRQAQGQRIRIVKRQLSAMINGDPDQGVFPLVPTRLGKFDAKITAPGQITKRAYIKWLRERRYERSLTKGMLSLDTALTLDDQFTSEYRLGPDGHMIKTPFSGIDLDIPMPSYIDFDDEVLGGTNRIVLIDPAGAIQRYVNVSAEYDAIEDFVLRKATGFRVDHGELALRMFDDAWELGELLPA